MIIDEYVAYHRQYASKYGDKTVIAMQIGDFYECYAYYEEDPATGELGETLVGADLPRICDLCNLQMTRKNKAILQATIKNPLMAGFPLYILAKHVQSLTSAGYTVVVIRQVTAPPNPRREVTDVFSPATRLEPSERDSSFLMVMNWTRLAVGTGAAGTLTAVGLAVVDVSSGETMVYEVGGHADNPSEPNDEAVRWLHTFAPKEIVVLGDGCDECILQNRSVHRQWRQTAQDQAIFERVAYQNEVFRRAFGADASGLLSPIETIGLAQWHLARSALVALLQFVHEHNERLVEHLRPPRFLSPKDHLHLAYNSAQQLNIIGSGGVDERPLLSLLNRCSTAFGARLFKDRMLHPITQLDALEARYRAIEEQLADPAKMHAQRRLLAGVQDLERMARRLAVRSFAPMEMPALVQSLTAGASALSCAQDGGGAQGCTALVDELCGLFVVDECAKYALADVKTNIFKTGLRPELDAISAEHADAIAALRSIADALSTRAGAEVKIDSNDRDGFFITTTKKRWEKAREAHEAGEGSAAAGLPFDIAKATARPISASSSIVHIHHPYLTGLSEKAVSSCARLRTACTQAYQEWLADSGPSVAAQVLRWVAPIAELDVSLTNAKNALDYGYSRPAPQAPDSAAVPSAWLHIHGLRHPLIERFLTDMAYVPNDVSLGGAAANGLLLYGMNAAGKSSLMKAVGLAVVMAQAGMYVPARDMRFVPFTSLFTRILGADNIYRGMSSFVVEMTELRNILQKADATSLVLGDELCSGTEAMSAISIVTAGVKELMQKRVPFVFATHLHDLVRIDPIKEYAEKGRLNVCHMHVEVDEAGVLRYDRSLRPGLGHLTYGIEVCRGLKMPDSFLKEADRVRRALQGVSATVVEPKVSAYNANVVVHACGVCGEPASEVHHIRYQKDAVRRGKAKVHGHVHQNHASNLVALCEACHQKEHAGKLHITGYIQTSEGRFLQVQYRGDAGGTGDTGAADTTDACGKTVPMDAIQARVRWDETSKVWGVRPHLSRSWQNDVDEREAAAVLLKFFPKLDASECLRQLRSGVSSDARPS